MKIGERFKKEKPFKLEGAERADRGCEYCDRCQDCPFRNCIKPDADLFKERLKRLARFKRLDNAFVKFVRNLF